MEKRYQKPGRIGPMPKDLQTTLIELYELMQDDRLTDREADELLLRPILIKEYNKLLGGIKTLLKNKRMYGYLEQMWIAVSEYLAAQKCAG